MIDEAERLTKEMLENFHDQPFAIVKQRGTVTYKKNFIIGDHQHEHIGFEDIVDIYESPVEAILRIKKVVHDAFKASNPHLSDIHAGDIPQLSGNHVPEVQVEKQPVRSTVQALIADINSCLSIKVLESYKLIARANPLVQAAYDAKTLELQS